LAILLVALWAVPLTAQERTQAVAATRELDRRLEDTPRSVGGGVGEGSLGRGHGGGVPGFQVVALAASGSCGGEER
jgi:hypothetical protein